MSGATLARGGSRIAARFAQLHQRGEKALVCYLTCGDPDLDTTRAMVLELARRGADVIELGVPFSEPTADGPVIQAAMGRSLRAGTNLRKVLALVESLRRETDVPFVLFSYYNPLYFFGVEALADEAARVGVDGFLVVDLPPEEARELAQPLGRVGVDYVPLLAPTSTPSRIAQAAELALGFLYYVALTGVTGASLCSVDEVSERVAALRSRVKAPIAVGFGVTTASDARRLGRVADGVVVGTALLRAAERAGGSGPDAIAAVGALVADLKSALKSPLL
jgi:tryptophan synthase alpha chain